MIQALFAAPTATPLAALALSSFETPVDVAGWDRGAASYPRPVYWVARGVPVIDRGTYVTHFPLSRESFYDPAEAVALCKAFRAEYPDAIVVCEQPV